MGDIHRMTSALADQIAAGEVVERPASVVKELIENAIDAGATRISVLVEQGGQRLIQVTDNGRGMDAADLGLAFERHATSKVRSAADLAAIATLGFRGEALPSIASVAKVVARSSTGPEEGHEITVEGGQAGSVKPAPPVGGTAIKVRNLFYNTPARRKFLKAPRTENQHIIEVVRRFALCCPDIAFDLTHGDKEVFRLPVSDLAGRIGAVFARHYKQSVRPVALSKEPFTVEGYVGNLSLVRGRPKEQYIFLNGRSVQDRLLNSAVYGAYQSLVSRGEYPFFVLRISMPLEAVDVNVHPAKSEVRFRDEWRVYHVVKLAVTEAIKDIPGMIPDFERPFGPAPYPAAGGPGLASALPPDSGTLFEQAPKPAGGDESGESGKLAGESRTGSHEQRPLLPEVPYNPELIWQVHNKYIFSQVASGVVMIDQHVAHERVLYEDALKAFNGSSRPSQSVLFPQVLELAADEYSRLIDMIPYLERLGFRLREFGHQTVIIEGLPIDVAWGREQEIITDVLDRTDGRMEGAEVFEKMAASYSCKAAVKAGDPLTLEEMRNVVDRLFATENPYYCPHGRPTVVHLSSAELDRRFERI